MTNEQTWDLFLDKIVEAGNIDPDRRDNINFLGSAGWHKPFFLEALEANKKESKIQMSQEALSDMVSDLVKAVDKYMWSEWYEDEIPFYKTDIKELESLVKKHLKDSIYSFDEALIKIDPSEAPGNKRALVEVRLPPGAEKRVREKARAPQEHSVNAYGGYSSGVLTEEIKEIDDTRPDLNLMEEYNIGDVCPFCDYYEPTCIINYIPLEFTSYECPACEKQWVTNEQDYFLAWI